MTRKETRPYGWSVEQGTFFQQDVHRQKRKFKLDVCPKRAWNNYTNYLHPIAPLYTCMPFFHSETMKCFHERRD